MVALATVQLGLGLKKERIHRGDSHLRDLGLGAAPTLRRRPFPGERAVGGSVVKWGEPGWWGQGAWVPISTSWECLRRDDWK